MNPVLSLKKIFAEATMKWKLRREFTNIEIEPCTHIPQGEPRMTDFGIVSTPAERFEAKFKAIRREDGLKVTGSASYAPSIDILSYGTKKELVVTPTMAKQ